MEIKMLTKHPESHLDHHLTDAQVAYVLQLFADRVAFFIETLELPAELGTVPCGLHGPLMGDAPVHDAEVTRERRGTRAWTSRLVDRPARPVRTVTVIAGPHGDHACIVYTMFGGPLAPQERGEIRGQIEEIERKRRKLVAGWQRGRNDLGGERALDEQLATLREKRATSDAFWAEHALSVTPAPQS
jgi:hypothetical protein